MHWAKALSASSTARVGLSATRSRTEAWISHTLDAISDWMMLGLEPDARKILDELADLIDTVGSRSRDCGLSEKLILDCCHLATSDVQAALDRDPSAQSLDEVLHGYSSVRAVIIHRFAHSLYRAGFQVVPRLMSSLATQCSGAEIHPGAEIGPSFFLDHGVGTVIGQTTVIGARCTIYHGVTLGLIRLPTNSAGEVIKNTKRHPTIGGDVTIFANAMVLGGDTVIASGSVIRAGSLVTSSVPQTPERRDFGIGVSS